MAVIIRTPEKRGWFLCKILRHWHTMDLTLVPVPQKHFPYAPLPLICEGLDDCSTDLFMDFSCPIFFAHNAGPCSANLDSCLFFANVHKSTLLIISLILSLLSIHILHKYAKKEEWKEPHIWVKRLICIIFFFLFLWSPFPILCIIGHGWAR